MKTIFAISERTDVCEICGRFPAKMMTFRTHRGYVVVRTVSAISGVFCRDHATEAYLIAQSGSLKGMWFGTASLVIGAASSVWDSLKLLDLPSEVIDGPFVSYKASCPSCKETQYSLAGSCKCDHCGTEFFVGSCAHCGVFRCSGSRESVLVCRNCHRPTPAELSVRYSLKSLIIAIAVEMAALANSESKDVDIAPMELLQSMSDSILGIENGVQIAEYYRFHYLHVLHSSEELRRKLKSSVSEAGRKFCFSLAEAICMSREEGLKNRLGKLKAMASSLGVEFQWGDEETHSERAEPAEIVDDCWSILGVVSDASEIEIKRAYRRRVIEVHPDSHGGRKLSQEAAARATKALNEAYEVALELTRSRTTGSSRAEYQAKEEEQARKQEQARREAQARRQEEADRQEKADRQERARRHEEANRQEQARRQEEARRQNQARRQEVEALRKEEEARKQEEARRQEETRRQEQARRQEEARKQDEARSIFEDAERAEERRRWEASRVAEETRKQEEERQKEEARINEVVGGRDKGLWIIPALAGGAAVGLMIIACIENNVFRLDTLFKSKQPESNAMSAIDQVLPTAPAISVSRGNSVDTKSLALDPVLSKPNSIITLPVDVEILQNNPYSDSDETIRGERAYRERTWQGDFKLFGYVSQIVDVNVHIMTRSGMKTTSLNQLFQDDLQNLVFYELSKFESSFPNEVYKLWDNYIDDVNGGYPVKARLLAVSGNLALLRIRSTNVVKVIDKDNLWITQAQPPSQWLDETHNFKLAKGGVVRGSVVDMVDATLSLDGLNGGIRVPFIEIAAKVRREIFENCPSLFSELPETELSDREWQSASGKYKRVAKLVARSNGHLILEQTGRELISVDLSKLSIADNVYANSACPPELD